MHPQAVRTRTKVPCPQSPSRPSLDAGTDGSSSDPRPAKPETTVDHLGFGHLGQNRFRKQLLKYSKNWRMAWADIFAFNFLDILQITPFSDLKQHLLSHALHRPGIHVKSSGSGFVMMLQSRCWLALQPSISGFSCGWICFQVQSCGCRQVSVFHRLLTGFFLSFVTWASS